jgi:hypothetical protein
MAHISRNTPTASSRKATARRKPNGGNGHSPKPRQPSLAERLAHALLALRLAQPSLAERLAQASPAERVQAAAASGLDPEVIWQQMVLPAIDRTLTRVEQIVNDPIAAPAE